MGMPPFFGRNSYCACGSYVEKPAPVIEVKAPANPRPKNFYIIRMQEIGQWLLAEVLYPDAKNFEGRKVMLYKDVTIEHLKKASFLDPHFCASREHITPVARFEPTEYGWKLALFIALNGRNL